MRVYDTAGRVTDYVSYSSPGVINERRTSEYNDNGQLLKQTSYNTSNVVTSILDYTNGYDAVGNVLKYTMQVTQGTPYTNTYTYNYLKYDTYKESVINATSTYWSPGNTTSTYDVNGNLVKVVDEFNKSPTRDLIVDTQGQILQKIENGKTQYYYYANNNPVGSAGDISDADFDYNYTPVSAQYPASTPGSYVVGQGDSLQSIAQAVYGDSALWYLIADANGIQTDADLTVGQTLKIPNSVTNIHNNAGTFKTYNPAQIIGDTTPTLADPAPVAGVGNNQCGMGQIFVLAISALIAFATAGVGSTAVRFFLGAIGSLFTQALSRELGLQDSVNFKSAVVSGFASGFGGSKVLDNIGKGAEKLGISAKFAKGIVSSAARQGASVIVGETQRFNWRAVAAAGVSAEISAKLFPTDKTLPGYQEPVTGPGFGKFIERVGRNFSQGLVTGIASSAISNKGKIDIRSIATDAFGNALGTSFGEQLLDSKAYRRPTQAELYAGKNPGAVAWGSELNYPSDYKDHPLYGDMYTSLVNWHKDKAIDQWRQNQTLRPGELQAWTQGISYKQYLSNIASRNASEAGGSNVQITSGGQSGGVFGGSLLISSLIPRAIQQAQKNNTNLEATWGSVFSQAYRALAGNETISDFLGLKPYSYIKQGDYQPSDSSVSNSRPNLFPFGGTSKIAYRATKGTVFTELFNALSFVAYQDGLNPTEQRVFDFKYKVNEFDPGDTRSNWQKSKDNFANNLVDMLGYIASPFKALGNAAVADYNYIKNEGFVSYLGANYKAANDSALGLLHITGGTVFNVVGYLAGSKEPLWEAADKTNRAVQASLLNGAKTLLFGSHEERQKLIGNLALGWGIASLYNKVGMMAKSAYVNRSPNSADIPNIIEGAYTPVKFKNGKVFALEGPVGKRRWRLKGASNVHPNLQRGNLDIYAPEGWAKHHLIGVNEAQNSTSLQRLAEADLYNINNRSNGIALPTNEFESFLFQKPLHNGGHLSSYYNNVGDRLRSLDAIQHRLTNSELLEHVKLMQDLLRQDIYRSLRLHNGGF